MVIDTYIALFPNVHDSSRHRISISRAEGGNYIWTLAFQSLNRRRGCDLWPRTRYSKTLKKTNRSGYENGVIKVLMWQVWVTKANIFVA
jgi:hypothetical protein